MTSTSPSLAAGFLGSAARHPARPALFAAGETWSYAELEAAAAAVAERLEASGASARIGVMAHRRPGTYAGVLGTLASGRTYVPLNPKFPSERNATILRAAAATTLVCDAAEAGSLESLLAAWASGDEAGEPRVVLVGEDGAEADDVPTAPRLAPAVAPMVAPEDFAYLMFTSGTTGRPKGVPIAHANVGYYVQRMLERYDPGPGDRFSQTFDLTFDLSVHDMFVCWAAGACLCVPPDSALMAPAKFVRDQALTMWFSVPSTIGFMQKFRQLAPGAFPTLRHSLFCGEALPAESARQWQAAAPSSTIDNLYGPTEATIAFTAYRWTGREGDEDLSAGLVPIGRPYAGLESAVLTADREPVGPGASGELYLGGPQVCAGYLDDPVRTSESFFDFALPGKAARRWYRTGDLVELAADGELRFMGRVDHQVKILGYRVELGEIEHVVRTASGSELVAAVPWPRGPSGASGVTVFTCGSRATAAEVVAACQTALPPYMVPKDVRELPDMPLNANGKIDRNSLTAILEAADGE